MSKSTKRKRRHDPSPNGHRPQQRGYDNAWPECPLVDGKVLELLWACAYAWQDLANTLNTAEQAAASGTGTNEIGLPGGTDYTSGVEARLTEEGTLADGEAQTYRDMRDRWRRRFAKLVLDMRVELGQAEPEKGPRDAQGRIRILSS